MEKRLLPMICEATRFSAEAKKVVMKALGDGAKHLDDRAMMYLYIEALKSWVLGGQQDLVPGRVHEYFRKRGSVFKQGSA